MAASERVYQFGWFRLDGRDRLLYREGQLVPLPPKVFDTLLLLVVNSGHVVTKDELMKQLWPETFVGEGTLTQCISLLRKALGDGGKWIENHPRRGYRFNAPVEEFVREEHSPVVSDARENWPRQDSPAEHGAEGLHRTKWGFGLAVVVLVAAVVLLAFRSSPRAISASTITSAPRLVRLTATSGLNTDPALSPDGNSWRTRPIGADPPASISGCSP